MLVKQFEEFTSTKEVYLIIQKLVLVPINSRLRYSGQEDIGFLESYRESHRKWASLIAIWEAILKLNQHYRW